MRRKIIFVWVPKTGGTSIYEALSHYGMRKFLWRSEAERYNQDGWATFGHMDYESLREHGLVSNETHNEALKFAFVRNPYDRFISLFFYFKKVGILDARCTMFSFSEGLIQNPPPPIGLFNVKRISQANPQCHWIYNKNGQRMVEYVGHTEQMNRDFHVISDLIGIEPFELPVLNKGSHDVQIMKDRLCETTKTNIRNFYRKDFELFGYDAE